MLQTEPEEEAIIAKTRPMKSNHQKEKTEDFPAGVMEALF